MTPSAVVPRVLPTRQRADVISCLLRRRPADVLPNAMRAAAIDCRLRLCQGDNLNFTGLMRIH